jgi:carbon monoxide dehydrogenase subunit G
MQLEHSFTVPATVDEAWKVLTDIERVAPCMPGAALESVDGDNFTGTVKVKLGPIGLTYKGKASFTEKDEAAHRAVLNAQGRDARGNGTASATVTATLAETEGKTKVNVVTDLDITGKPAQFGRGVMVDVGNKLIGQFADCLAGKLGGGPDEAPVVAPGAAAAVEAAPAATVDAPPVDSVPVDAPPVDAPPVDSVPVEAPPIRSAAPSSYVPVDDVEPINLIHSAGPAVAKRLAPLLGLILLVVIVLRRRKR